MEIKTVTFHRAAYQPGDFPRDRRPQFAIVGRSNVGKSSLINAVLRKKAVARVSQTPGKTQAVQFYLVNERFYIVDLPGYGYAKVSKTMRSSWAQLIQSYLQSSEDLRLIFLLLDARRIPSGEDLQMHEWTQGAAIDERIALTKSDKLSKNQMAQSRIAIAEEMQLDPRSLIECSVVTRKGIDEVRREIAARL